jgi:uncharacterized protein (DUF952 family)
MARYILHLADAGDWRARTDVYRTGDLDDEGFIHCSTSEQLRDVALRHFSGQNDLILLTIDPALLDAPIVYEDLYDTGEEFPHVYGPITVSAVVSATPHLEHLEEGMWRETRADPKWLARVLHPDFLEVGRSGRVYDRREAIETTDYPYEFELPLDEFVVDFVREDVALVTYVSRESLHGEELPAHRTSLWIHDEAGWRIRFHQGTPMPPGPGGGA